MVQPQERRHKLRAGFPTGWSGNEVVEDSINGYLIAFPIRMNLLLERLGTLIERPELRERMGREGRRKVEEKFDFEKAVRAYEQVLIEVKEGAERF